MCQATGCWKPATKFSNLCEYHRNVFRIHGDPKQNGITKAELKPYIKVVEEYLAKRSGPRAEAVIRKDWNRVVKEADEFLATALRGSPHSPHARRAAQIVSDIAKDHHAMEVAVLGMALGFFYEDQPRRWASDQGFQFQAVRMLRRFARGETAYSWRPDGSMVRSSANRCPPSVTRALWTSFEATSFISYGIQIRREIEKERQLKRKDRIADLREILGPTSFAAKGEAL